jgi:hypothetical protein
MRAVILLLLSALPLPAQILTTTIAGGSPPPGISPFSISAGGITGVAIDPDGSVYICSGGVNRIYKIDATGRFSVYAGTGVYSFSGDGGPAAQATFRNPQQIALDSDGNLYVADRINHRVRVINKLTGIITTVAGTGRPSFSGDGRPATQAAINEPFGVDVDAAGNVFIAPYYNARILKVEKATGLLRVVAGTGAVLSQAPVFYYAATQTIIGQPQFVHVDRAGLPYFSVSPATAMPAACW